MQSGRIVLGALALFVTTAAGFAAGRSFTQDPPVAKPGEEHEWLASLAGEYTCKVNAMGSESEGTNKIESRFGGLWNITHFESTMMGQPFQGMEILGYDPQKGKYVSAWIDSMSTSLTTMEGTYDPEAKKMTMKGMSVGMDGEQAEMVNVTEFTEGGMTFAMSMMEPDGSQMPVMTIDYTRKK